MKKPKTPKAMFTTENGLPANVYCLVITPNGNYSFDGLPQKKANWFWKLCRKDKGVNTLFATSYVYLVELMVGGTPVYLLYDMSSITHAEAKLAENLTLMFNNSLELAQFIIYDGRIHRTYSRTGQLIIEALKKGISPDINALLKPVDSQNQVQG